METDDQDTFEPIGAVLERLMRNYLRPTLQGLPIVEAPPLARDGHELAHGLPARPPCRPVLVATERKSGTAAIGPGCA